MSTRGVVGFRLDEKDYLAYNHSDSYPSWLGRETVVQLAELLCLDTDKLATLVRNLKVVTEDAPPPADSEERERLSKWTNNGVATPDDYWYRTLRETQGDIQAILEAGYILDATEFIKDSLFCEWGYIVNLDSSTLEVYEGHQTKRHTKGRYAGNMRASAGRYPCALIAEIPFQLINDDPEEAVKRVLELEGGA